MAIYTITTIICGISENLVLFFVMRILQGAFSSAGKIINNNNSHFLFFIFKHIIYHYYLLLIIFKWSLS